MRAPTACVCVIPLNINKDLKFSFDSQQLEYSVEEFWSWAFSSITTPVIRGVMVEFILAQHLIDQADQIVRKRVLDLTHQVPALGQIAKGLRDTYGSQPHGDVFDLQLTWGVTIEIKSTSNRDTWRLNKTCRWNMAKDKNKAEKIFPAQYYILAVVENDPQAGLTHLNLPDAEFYVCSGRTLDTNIKASQKSVGFSKFSKYSVRCDFRNLVPTLYELQRQEHERVSKLLIAGWKQPNPPSFTSTFYPLAVETNGAVTSGWYAGSNGTVHNVMPLHHPWAKGVTPDWRDWEAAGFKYEPEV
ncbi:MAG: hypothetical protein GAK37_02429 [Pseudomonas sp.]|nr:MAG: hypothetical protein GAK37_02429 [Pseudomonas sp.]